MAVVCEACGHRAHRLRYETPPRAPRDVRVFLALAVVCGLLGIYHLTVLLFDVIPIVDQGEELGIGRIEIPGSGLGLLRDFIQLYNNSTRYFLAVMLLALAYVPARTFGLVISSLNAHPYALLRLRRILMVQFGIEAFSTSALLALSYNLEVIEIPFRFGYNLVLAPLAVVASLRPAVKEHFSAHGIERVAPPAPAISQ